MPLPTPLPTNFDADPAFLKSPRSIALFSSREQRALFKNAPLHLFHTDSILDLLGRVSGGEQPLTLLHADWLQEEDVETASLIRDLPGDPLVALLGSPENMSRAFDLARRLGLGAILPEEAVNHPRLLNQWGDWLAEAPAPGVASHMGRGAEINEYPILSKHDKPAIINRILQHVQTTRGGENPIEFHLQLILEEAVNNAILHAFRNEAGDEKYDMDSFESLGEGEEVSVTFGADDRTIGIAVRDNQGWLKRDLIYEKIQRQLSQQGVMDQSGRGIYLAYSLAGRTIFNLKARKFSEMVILFPRHPLAWNEPTPVRSIFVFNHK